MAWLNCQISRRRFVLFEANIASKVRLAGRSPSLRLSIERPIAFEWDWQSFLVYLIRKSLDGFDSLVNREVLQIHCSLSQDWLYFIQFLLRRQVLWH